MYCKKCGAPNDDNAWKCVQCGSEMQQAPALLLAAPTVIIPSYLVQSIVCTLLCCLPLGIPAIVYAAQVNTKVAQGDIAGARNASKNAKMWCWISFGVGLAFGLGYLLLALLGIVRGVQRR